MYVYIQSDTDVWAVGFYDPKGIWISESNHESPDKAADRVNWLNGGHGKSSKEHEISREEMEQEFAETYKKLDADGKLAVYYYLKCLTR